MPEWSKESIQFLLQYPLAGLVVFVVGLFLWFLRDWAKAERDARAKETEAERAARAKESQAEREARATEQKAMRDFIAIQNELFLQAVKDIREQNNAALARLAEEIKTNHTEVSRLVSVVTAHDAVSRERASTTGRK